MSTFTFTNQLLHLLDIPAALPAVGRPDDTTQEQPVVEVVTAGIAFDNDVVAGFDGVFAHAPRLKAAHWRPLDFPLYGLAGLRVLGLQLDQRVGVGIGELNHLTFEVDALFHEIVSW